MTQSEGLNKVTVDSKHKFLTTKVIDQSNKLKLTVEYSKLYFQSSAGRGVLGQ